MQHTTHGLMTPADLADHQKLTDTGPHPDCPGHFYEGSDGGIYVRTIHSVADHCPGDDGGAQAYDIQIPAPGGGRMGIYERICNYQRQTGREGLTPRQRRRMLKKAGRDPGVTVVRDEGMGYPRSMQGYREIVGDVRPVSGAPV
jgi:hypothetical protein